MVTTREAASSIFGAYRLAFLDRSGLHYLDGTPEGALRSFYAALICAPAAILVLLMQQWPEFQQTPLLRFIAVEGLGYVVDWAGYALAIFYACRLFGRLERYPQYLSAYNWAQVIEAAVLLPAVALAQSDLLPDGVGDGLVSLVLVAILVYEWFIARVALDIGRLAAAGVVVLSMVVIFIIDTTVHDMLVGAPIPPA
jgi:hypothetical protein